MSSFSTPGNDNGSQSKASWPSVCISVRVCGCVIFTICQPLCVAMNACMRDSRNERDRKGERDRLFFNSEELRGES